MFVQGQARARFYLSNRETLSVTAKFEKTLHAGSPVFVEVDTSVLIENGRLSSDCNDLRIFYFNGSATIEINQYIDEQFPCNAVTLD
jgi:hypothetical protein